MISTPFITHSAPVGTQMGIVKYMFLETARLTAISPDGVEVLMGYGIGDIIEVIEPRTTFLIAGMELDEITLKDGTLLKKSPGHKIIFERVQD